MYFREGLLIHICKEVAMSEMNSLVHVRVDPKATDRFSSILLCRLIIYKFKDELEILQALKGKKMGLGRGLTTFVKD
jgi:hypothetical protein